MGKRLTFRSALHLNTAIFGHHHVHVGLRGGVFDVPRSQMASPFTIPTETAATILSSDWFSACRRRPATSASASATQAPVTEAVRVPPSACSTSQSSNREFAQRFQVNRCAQRTGNQALNFHRPAALLAFCRFTRVTRVRRTRQHAVFSGDPALAWPFRKRGTPSSIEAVHSTLVSPNSTSTEPSACFV